MKAYDKSAPETIRQMFDSIAKQYDLTNAILSFNMHKRWNKTLIDKAIAPNRPETFLDLCCGTGAIALPYLSSTEKPVTAYLLDFSEGMLTCAKARAQKYPVKQHAIHYLQADAQVIPLLAESVDCVSIAYGIRNIKDPSRCLMEVSRVLKPGGMFGILELTQPTNPLLRWGHRFYLTNVLPLIGKVAASNEDAYKYLCNSISSFVPPEKLTALLLESGFSDVKCHPLMGGIATVITGTKSLQTP